MAVFGRRYYGRKEFQRLEGGRGRGGAGAPVGEDVRALGGDPGDGRRRLLWNGGEGGACGERGGGGAASVFLLFYVRWCEFDPIHFLFSLFSTDCFVTV